MPLDGSSVHLNRSMDQNNPLLRERLSGAINAISISPDNNAVVVAGREGKERNILTLNVKVFA